MWDTISSFLWPHVFLGPSGSPRHGSLKDIRQSLLIVSPHRQPDRTWDQRRDTPLGTPMRPFPGRINCGEGHASRVGSTIWWSRGRSPRRELYSVCLPWLLFGEGIFPFFLLWLPYLTNTRAQILQCSNTG